MPTDEVAELRALAKAKGWGRVTVRGDGLVEVSVGGDVLGVGKTNQTAAAMAKRAMLSACVITDDQWERSKEIETFAKAEADEEYADDVD